MIILDTHVVSEPLKPSPSARVISWLDRQSAETLFLTAISAAELLAGVAALPQGKRRRELERTLQTRVFPLFDGRVLPFDLAAASAFASVTAGAKAAGNTMGFADGAIAAVASANDFILATRNGRDFKGCDIKIVDPWE